jgi:rhomboid protease GluP
MKSGSGTVIVIAGLLIGFGIEIATHSVGNEAALLKLGALPDDGNLNGEYWRLATYWLLHLNGAHLLVNVLLLFWLGRKVEKRVNRTLAATIFVSSVLFSAIAILVVHGMYPKPGATVGASGSVFGLLAATLVISYGRHASSLAQERSLRTWLWIVLITGLGVSFLPGVSMAGHLGGLVGGALPAAVATPRE